MTKMVGFACLFRYLFCASATGPCRNPRLMHLHYASARWFRAGTMVCIGYFPTCTVGLPLFFVAASLLCAGAVIESPAPS